MAQCEWRNAYSLRDGTPKIIPYFEFHEQKVFFDFTDAQHPRPSAASTMDERRGAHGAHGTQGHLHWFQRLIGNPTWVINLGYDENKARTTQRKRGVITQVGFFRPNGLNKDFRPFNNITRVATRPNATWVMSDFTTRVLVSFLDFSRKPGYGMYKKCARALSKTNFFSS